MTNWVQGLIAGTVFGIVSVLVMIPMPFPSKRDAMVGAFVNRFGIGFVIAVAVLPVHGWLKGGALGLLLSLPAAVIAKAWVPILGLGLVGGVVVGWLVG